MLHQIMGSYIPSAFSIRLNSSPEKLDVHDQTFVHEYIHFLQDLLLPYCIRSSLKHIRSFSYIAILNKNGDGVPVPFNHWDDDTRITDIQLSYTWGRGTFKNTVTKIADINSDYRVSPYNHKVYRYFAKTADGTKYQLGARDFLEHIAHKIENRFWQISAPDFPYKTLDKIFEYYKLSFLPENIRILIAEYCLHNDNPIHFLIKSFILDGVILDNKEIFSKYEACSDYLLQLGWISNGGFNESIYSKTERRLTHICKNLSDLYNGGQFSSINKWILNTNAYCKENLANVFIFSGMYNMPLEKFKPYLSTLVDDIGIPLIIFEDHSITTRVLPAEYNSSDFIAFYIISKFMEWTVTETRKCPILDLCVKNYGLCTASCLNFTNNLDRECPMNFILKSYGFGSKSFIFPIN